MKAGARSSRSGAMDLAAKVALLKQTSIYPEQPAHVDVVETHMSCLFLTDRHVYKLKKPVRYDFLDFSTLEARKRNCFAEVRLNRRLAPGVYLDAIPLRLDAGGDAVLGDGGETIEWLVKMRRLPAARMLDVMIRHGGVTRDDVGRVALKLARFYQRAKPADISGVEYRKQLVNHVQNNYRGLRQPADGLPSELIRDIHEAQLGVIRREAAVFDRRVEEGRVVEGHGDLRPEHICLEPDPVIIDCLEFNRLFRIVDAVDELAFLALECERLGSTDIGPWLFGVYEQVTGDRPPQWLIDFYKSYRACLRARLAIWHTRDVPPGDWPKWQRTCREYLALAQRYQP